MFPEQKKKCVGSALLPKAGMHLAEATTLANFGNLRALDSRRASEDACSPRGFCTASGVSGEMVRWQV